MKQLIITTFTILSLASCASSIPINLSCDEQHIEIYVNDEYAGRGLIHYIVPKGDDYINVSCRENGIEIYSRTFYVKGKKNQLFELAIPKDYRYSSGQQIKPQIREPIYLYNQYEKKSNSDELLICTHHQYLCC